MSGVSKATQIYARANDWRQGQVLRSGAQVDDDETSVRLILGELFHSRPNERQRQLDSGTVVPTSFLLFALSDLVDDKGRQHRVAPDSVLGMSP